MISLQEAIQLVLQQARSFGNEEVQLDDAVGRVLYQTVVADRDYPPFNRATMDGIAIAMRDWENGIHSFVAAETIYAGAISTQTIKTAECYKIMTGAAVPPSANAVIRREDIDEQQNRLNVTVSEVKAAQNIAAKGTDIPKGKVIIESRQLIKPGTVTTLASLGYAALQVEKLPSVAIITTGNEVVSVDAAVNEVQIRNSNAALLKALLKQLKIKPTHCEHVQDDAEALLKAVKNQLHNDILILSGAVSAGDADFVPEVLLKAGVKKIFHTVAIRPGKPAWFGQFDNGATVFALPGNPFSTFVTFNLFITSFLSACYCLPQTNKLHVAFDGTRIKRTYLDEFFPVTLSGNPTVAKPVAFNTSGDITAVLNADALALQAADEMEIKNGDIISCMLL